MKKLIGSLLLSVLTSSTTLADNNIFRTLEGRWTWAGKNCETTATTIGFSAKDHAVFKLKKPDGSINPAPIRY